MWGSHVFHNGPKMVKKLKRLKDTKHLNEKLGKLFAKKFETSLLQ
jgi:hypothetical protein